MDRVDVRRHLRRPIAAIIQHSSITYRSPRPALALTILYTTLFTTPLSSAAHLVGVAAVLEREGELVGARRHRRLVAVLPRNPKGLSVPICFLVTSVRRSGKHSKDWLYVREIATLHHLSALHGILRKK